MKDVNEVLRERRNGQSKFAGMAWVAIVFGVAIGLLV